MNIISVVCKTQRTKTFTFYLWTKSTSSNTQMNPQHLFSHKQTFVYIHLISFSQNVSIVWILFREKWCDHLLNLQTHLFTIPKPEECGITTNLGFRADFIMLGTVDLYFGNKTPNYSVPKINIQQASQPPLFKSSEKYRNKQYKAWQNSIPRTVLRMIMSAFQRVVWLYNWEALCVFDLFTFF